MTHPLAARFARHCARSNLVTRDAPLIVALSGGLDSQVLLHLVRFAVPHGGVRAAHFDHRMRATSGADAAWVAGLCRAWQVPLFAAASSRPLRSETAARAARYDWFEALAALLPDAAIATAHHADDQAETILFRILRGAGMRGLRGIPSRRGVYVRPLLPFTRAELAAYARAVGLRPRDDPTNRDVGRPRGAIRHLLLPHLERSRPGARAAVLRLGAAASAFEAALEPVLEALENAAVLDRREGEILLASNVLRPYHPEIRAALLLRLLRALGCAPGRAGTRAALQFISAGRSGGRIELPGGVILERRFDALALRQATALPPDAELLLPGRAAGSGRARIGGREVSVAWRTRAANATTAEQDPAGATRCVADAGGADPSAGSGPWSTDLDPDAVAFPLRLRAWRPGDRIRLGYGSKKLKKLFGELRYSRQARSRTPVLAEGRDRILWVVGVVRSVDAPAGDGREILRITVRHD